MKTIITGMLIAAIPLVLVAQSSDSGASPKNQQSQAATVAPQSAGGVETGPPHAAQIDEQRRPITAGGFVASGPVIFQDISEKAGLTRWTHKMGTPQKKYIIETNGSGVCLIDYDNDGWLDIYVVNGSTFDALDGKETPPHAALFHNNWALRPMLFHNIEGKKFEPVPAVAGTGLADVISGRGLAVGDLFNDGKLDVVINVEDGHPVLLRNVSPDKNHWLELKLVGGPKSPRDAVGATVYLTANGMKQRADVVSGGSYASTSDPRPHFGLGQATRVDDIEVRWPSGKVEHFTVPGVDRILTITEGSGVSASAAPQQAAAAAR